MHVLLTGATGYIGSAILPRLLERGHDVTAAVRSREKADAVDGLGGTGVVADFADRAHLVYLMSESDAVIHTAAPASDQEAFDRGVAEAAIEALAGSGAPYVHTGGAWVYGSGDAIVESDPVAPPAITSWRPRVQALLEQAELPLTVVHPSIVHGYGRGIAMLLADPPRTADGRFTTVGSGQQHWGTVHVDDLADLYVAVLEAGGGFGSVIGVADRPRVLDLSAAAAGAAGVATEDEAATRERLGEPMAEALLLDQRPTGEKARSIGGWHPTRPTLLEELAAR